VAVRRKQRLGKRTICTIRIVGPIADSGLRRLGSGWGDPNAAWSERPLIVFSVHGPVGESGYIARCNTFSIVLPCFAAVRPCTGRDSTSRSDIAATRANQNSAWRNVTTRRLTNEFDLASCGKQRSEPPFGSNAAMDGEPCAPTIAMAFLSRVRGCRG